MAFITDEQNQRLQELRATYGQESRVSLEHTDAPYGLLRVQWFDGGNQPLGMRALYIKPDGERLTWSTR